MNVGFIGLGIMGASMASNLQAAGHALSVHDIRRDAAARHLAAGAVWKDTPRAVAEDADVVFLSLPGPPEVEAVALGPDGEVGNPAGKDKPGGKRRRVPSGLKPEPGHNCRRAPHQARQAHNHEWQTMRR